MDAEYGKYIDVVACDIMSSALGAQAPDAKAVLVSISSDDSDHLNSLVLGSTEY